MSTLTMQSMTVDTHSLLVKNLYILDLYNTGPRIREPIWRRLLQNLINKIYYMPNPLLYKSMVYVSSDVNTSY